MIKGETLESDIENIINLYIDWDNSDCINECKKQLAEYVRQKQISVLEYALKHEDRLDIYDGSNNEWIINIGWDENDEGGWENLTSDEVQKIWEKTK